MKQHINYSFTLVALLQLMLFFNACKSGPVEEKQTAEVLKETVELSPAQFEKAGITSMQMQERTMYSIVKVNGSIDVPPQNMVSVSMPMGGFLRHTKLLPGMHLKKGEVIAEMEDPLYIQLQQDYLTALSNSEFLEMEYRRQSLLNQSKAGSDKVLEQAKAAYTSQKIALKALSEKIKLMGLDPAGLNAENISRSIRIRSPIDGYVSKVNVNVGKYVNPSDVLFELVNPDDIHLNLTIFEKDLSKLRIGQKVNAYTNTDPDRIYPCELILIGQDVSDDRSVEVHCHFERYDRMLIPGMYMNAEIRTGGSKVFCIQESAIVSYQGRDYVFVVRGERRYALVQVEAGMKENGFVEITNASAMSGSEIVVSGAYELLMSLKNSGE